MLSQLSYAPIASKGNGPRFRAVCCLSTATGWWLSRDGPPKRTVDRTPCEHRANLQDADRSRLRLEVRISRMVDLSGFEPLTLRLSGVRSNQLSYRSWFHVPRQAPYESRGRPRIHPRQAFGPPTRRMKEKESSPLRDRSISLPDRTLLFAGARHAVPECATEVPRRSFRRSSIEQTPERDSDPKADVMAPGYP